MEEAFWASCFEPSKATSKDQTELSLSCHAVKRSGNTFELQTEGY